MVEHPRPTSAALLVPITEIDGFAAVILTRRTSSIDHGGDWVFPGGRVHADDPSEAEAARREASEELGVDCGLIEIIGQLATRGPIVTGQVIQVFVGVMSGPLVLRPDANEVSAVEVIELADFLDPARCFRSSVELDLAHRARDSPGFGPGASLLRHYLIDGDHHLWGMQADILHELLHHLTGGSHDF
jgi:8-oxo-dGTP pyrophosphatase MutT (NUDIX family)